MYELFDVHGHFLPGMDDGCKTPGESVQALKMSARQGVKGMFATPHYYSTEPIGEFLDRRQEALRRLRAQIEQEQAEVPEVLCGAEVACRPGLSGDPDLYKLCLGNTRYMLLELPWSGWGSEIEREIRNISCVCGIMPILAHLERYIYMGIAGKDQISRLLQMDLLVQVNAESFMSFSGRRAIGRLKRQNMIHLLGSDCHNVTTRSPNLGPVCQYMRGHGMGELHERMTRLAKELFEAEKP